MKSCQQAKQKNLAVGSGLCWRSFNPRRELMKRVLDGMAGDILAVETTYNSAVSGTPGSRAGRGQLGDGVSDA